MKNYKIWGITLDGRNRYIVAAHSQKQAAELMKTTLAHFREYASLTGNQEEIQAALTNPYTVINRGRS